jgi:hypothetical protein
MELIRCDNCEKEFQEFVPHLKVTSEGYQSYGNGIFDYNRHFCSHDCISKYYSAKAEKDLAKKWELERKQ